MSAFQSDLDLNDIKWNDIDWLRDHHERLYYFGLGFIQLKIDDKFRMHMWSPSLPVITEDIHNHRYWFRSHILSGEITNVVYSLTDGPTHVLRNESCNPDIDAPADEKLCVPVVESKTTYRKGDSYYMTDSMFHRVHARKCVTLLERSPYCREFAQVVSSVGAAQVCPFSVQISDTDLWEIIRESI